MLNPQKFQKTHTILVQDHARAIIQFCTYAAHVIKKTDHPLCWKFYSPDIQHLLPFQGLLNSGLSVKDKLTVELLHEPPAAQTS